MTVAAPDASIPEEHKVLAKASYFRRMRGRKKAIRQKLAPEVVKLVSAGVSIRQAAKRTGVSFENARRWWNEHKHG
ncbi:MAG: hypothetical protein Aurels2KO_21940 [Aureliella sp.]